RSSPEVAERAVELYRRFCKAELVTTNTRTADMSKLVENSCRDVNIAFANERSMLSDGPGIEGREVSELAHRHTRVTIMQPGAAGVGHCIAVDPCFIVAAAPDTATIIRNAREINDSKPEWVISQIKAAAFDVQQETGRTPVIAALGLAFKPNIDDLRESPALNITEALSDQFNGSKILAVEPHIDQLPQRLQNRGNLELAEVNEAIDRA